MIKEDFTKEANPAPFSFFYFKHKMEDLEYLEVVSHVTSQLNNHWQIDDADLAEFVVELGKQSSTPQDFRKKLEEYNASTSETLASNLFRAIKRWQSNTEETTTPPDRMELKESGVPKTDESGAPILQLNPKYTPMPPKRERSLERGSTGPERKGQKRDAVPALQLFTVYPGEVVKITAHGCFVRFETTQGLKEGFCHVSEYPKEKKKPRNADSIEKFQQVYVKTLGLAGRRIRLTMKDLDQTTGENLIDRKKLEEVSKDEDDEGESRIWQEDDLFKGLTSFQKKTEVSDPLGSLTGIKKDVASLTTESLRKDRIIGMTDLEKWEEKQLLNSGMISITESSKFDTEAGTILAPDFVEEEFDIELNEDQPLFLDGLTTKGGVHLSPVKITAQPDGSLARAAATASALAKERRELKEQQEKQVLDSIPRNISRPWEDPKPDMGERTLAQTLRGVGHTSYEMPEWKKVAIGKSLSYGQRSDMPLTKQKESLPIFKLKHQLLEGIRDNQVLVVIGETGSGKTTQITQYLAEAGFTSKGMIGCTQPRRVAAMSVAKRVAEEYGCRLGEEVGYGMRFDDCTSDDTLIKYMTDGLLLRETLVDPELRKYSVVMLDEAHERSISTDVLFGLLKRVCQLRKDFKLIVTSATLDAEKFSSYFFNAHIFMIPGRTFPVEILHSKEPESDYVEAALITVLQIHLCETMGDILVFLTGQEEIDTACQVLHERMQKLKSMDPPPLIILPVYAALPSEVQTMIFEPAPPGCRKCVVATNIAEASLTIDGIYFVVDPGFAKVKVFNPKSRMESLTVVPISQANARQRSGRAGRTGPGRCYRLYTEEAYRNEMRHCEVPEIQRTNLSNTVLFLKALGVSDLMTFDFMDPPDAQTLTDSLESLFELGALDSEGSLTPMGFKMAEFPMDPSLSKMLLTSVDLNCADEIVTIVSMLQVPNIFYRPKAKQALADQKKSKFHQPEGDHITFLEVFKSWQRNRCSSAWCMENFVQARALQRSLEVRKQLVSILDRFSLELTSCGRDYNKVRLSVCAGYFRNACRKDPTEGYRTITDNHQAYMHPSSALYQRNPEWIVYTELVQTSREYLRDCSTIEPHWLTEVAPGLYKKVDTSKISRRKQQEKLEPLFNRHEEPNAWRLSRRRG
eukprot:GHVP01030160.1.p1 GENE.GHVP01030160.1~~GHVP01030160.1.p1  ORF type:complete len:1142 (-),score=242.96 GHVP01030160.1:1960-5385(-)